MSLELTLLVAFIGLVTMNIMLGDSGPIGAFKNAGPSLGARMEVEMTAGRCFSTPQNGTACTQVLTWK